MTRISNTDQVLLLLHEQLDRLNKKRGNGAAKARPVSSGTPEPVERLRARAARHGLADDDLKRALVRSLLTQQLGEGVANDPAFEAIASDVARVIERTAEGRALMERALSQLNN